MPLIMTRRAFSSPPAGSNDFFTNFPANENPLSQGSIWLNGATDGLDWQNVKTTNVTDGIQRACATIIPSGFDDPSAILKPSFRTFHDAQFAQGTIYRQSGYTPPNTFHESELRVRSNISANSCTGYEVLIALNDPAISQDGYAVIKWNGLINDFTGIYNGGSGSLVPVISDGDVFRVEVSGSTLTLYRNGSLVNTHDLTKDQFGAGISVWSSGQPGVGFYPQPGCTTDAYGWKSFRAGDLA